MEGGLRNAAQSIGQFQLKALHHQGDRAHPSVALVLQVGDETVTA
jgi:hypothetical protein